MSENWYDEGEGSESLKRKIAKSAHDNPVTPGPCICCDKVRKLQAENKHLRARLDAVEQLTACYRLHRRPTEKLLRLLDKTKQALN